MNKSKMDNMFREKLHAHKVAPRPEAWNKLKGNLDSDRKKVLLIYWRVAAIIILLLGSVALYIKVKNTDLRNPVTEKQQQEIKPLVENNDKIGDPGLAEGQQPAIESSQKQVEPKPLARQETITLSEQVKESKPINLQKDPVLAAAQGHPENRVANTQDNIGKSTHIEAVTPIDPRKLSGHEMGSEEMIAAFDKRLGGGGASGKNDTPSVTITFKKDQDEVLGESIANNELKGKEGGSALKKVMNLARGIKKGEVGISTLREKKDELLAFNFKKKKNVKNSK